MKKKLSFQRELLERIDYFNYLDPDSLCKMCKEEDKDKEEADKEEEASDEELSRVKRYSRPVLARRTPQDVRRYLQYVNVKSD